MSILAEIRLDMIDIPDIQVDDSFKQSICEEMKYPPLVTDAPEDSEYEFEIVDGRRRLKAAQDLELESVECLLDPETENDLLPVILNTQRSPNPAMESEMIHSKIEDEGVSQSELTELLGISQGSISKRLKLQDLIEPFFEGVRRMEFGPEKGYNLAKLDKKKQQELYEENGLDLTNRQIKEERRLKVTEELDMEQVENVEKEHMGTSRVYVSFDKDEVELVIESLIDYKRKPNEEMVNAIIDKIEGSL